MAVRLFRPLADTGLAAAQCNLGIAYLRGHGVRRAYGSAATWFRKAAEQDHAQAQAMLGAMYYEGRGVPRSCFQAVKWLRKAVEQNSAPALALLATMYHRGDGIPKDPIQAHKWFSLAARLGHRDAAKNRDTVAATMTSAQVKEARLLARAWSRSHERP